jgi:putative transposase
MDDKDELRRRRQAIRLWLKGVAPSQVLQRVQRGRTWFSKWRDRFERLGTRGLGSQSRQPRHRPAAHSPQMVRWIVRTRQRLARERVGLIGPRAIRRELRRLRLGQRLPSLATIKRVIKAEGLTASRSPATSAYRPLPLTQLAGCLQAMDWTCRYLEGGAKVYAFHTLNLHTRACAQTIAADKTTATVIQHALQAWKSLGIPTFLQLDNDAAFNGGYKVPRVFGQFVRLVLYVGIELIFLPVGEPECNGDIEQFNRLWAHAFFERQHFLTVAGCRRASPTFVQWYHTQYAPPKLGDRTPLAAHRAAGPHRRLTERQIAQLPEQLPITAGRVHFIRPVTPDGTIALLNQTWPVGKRWAGQYVWATITTHSRRLDVWYQRSIQHDWRLLKSVDYDLPEPVAHRPIAFRP